MSSPASAQTTEQAAILAEYRRLLQEWNTYPVDSIAHMAHSIKVRLCSSRAIRAGITMAELASVGDEYTHLFK